MAHDATHPKAFHHPHEGCGLPERDRVLMSFDDFCFAYEERPTLRHVSLDVYAGDSVVLMGDNGSGKSTLLKAMSGLVFAQRGSYRFDGEEGPRQMGLGEEAVRRRVDDVCRMIGIDELRGRAPWALSGGEKKKVAIGCILSMNPDVYCFDEPLNGLDARTRAWLLGFLHQLKDAGKTLVIATHDQSLADEVADYFVYMGDFHEYGDRPHVHINQ